MRKKFANLALIASVFIVIASPIAFGHADLQGQNPEAGSVIEVLPSRVELTFSENLIQLGDGNRLQMLDPNGDEVTTGDVVVNASTLSRELKTSDIQGDYYISYRAVSEDGHVVAGESGFTLSVSPQEIDSNVVPKVVPVEETNSGVLNSPVVVSVVAAAILSLCFVFWRSRGKKL
jgi:methionine-rich copper-binding protein CopC